MRSSLIIKQNMVTTITKRLSDSTAIIILEYAGLDVTVMNELRNILRPYGACLKIYKNRLVKIAVENINHKDLQPSLVGPNALVLMSTNNMKITKEVVKFIKTYKTAKLKVGLFDGKVIDKAALIKIALLPSRGELLAMLINGLQHPLRMFALTTKAIIKQQQAKLN